MIVREKERDNEKKRETRVREKGRDVYKKDTVMKKLQIERKRIKQEGGRKIIIPKKLKF